MMGIIYFITRVYVAGAALEETKAALVSIVLIVLFSLIN